MSLTSDDLADIKQLMTAVIRAEISGVHEEIDGLRKEMNQRFEDIDRRFEDIDRRFDENAEAQNEILNAIGTEFADHEKRLNKHDLRLARLEKQAA
ncbi:MAG: hypothetical protein Q4B05_02140 [Candidatus Saccharibacteria bacterium]|nr:hypothetical protein [Candidatus Saccharibacteria bacterium]